MPTSELVNDGAEVEFKRKAKHLQQELSSRVNKIVVSLASDHGFEPE